VQASPVDVSVCGTGSFDGGAGGGAVLEGAEGAVASEFAGDGCAMDP
jgi:hypothetical protein